MDRLFGKMRRAVGLNRSNKSNKDIVKNVTFNNNTKNKQPLKFVFGERVNMNRKSPTRKILKKKSFVTNENPIVTKKNTFVTNENPITTKEKPPAINYEKLLIMNKERMNKERINKEMINKERANKNELENLHLQIVHQNHPNAATNMELYGKSGKIFFHHKQLIEDMKLMGKYNLYKSIILTSTIVATTATLDAVLASTIILTPLVAALTAFTLKVNEYIQGKYLWQTGVNSFTEQDIETLINILNMYIRILSSPIIKPLFQERALYEEKFNEYMILKSIVDGVLNENDPSVSDHIRNIYHAIIKFRNRHDKKISVWNVFKIMDYSRKITFVIEQIIELNLIKDKLKFIDLFNLFISYYNILEMMINIQHTKADNIEWMLEIEKKEKTITEKKVKLMSSIQFDIKQHKDNPWFRIKKDTSYDISRHEIIKLAELT